MLLKKVRGRRFELFRKKYFHTFCPEPTKRQDIFRWPKPIVDDLSPAHLTRLCYPLKGNYANLYYIYKINYDQNNNKQINKLS